MPAYAIGATSASSGRGGVGPRARATEVPAVASSTPDALWSSRAVRLLRPAAVAARASGAGIGREQLLDGVDLQVAVGARLLLVAEPDAAGSLLLRMLAGLARADKGSFRIARSGGPDGPRAAGDGDWRTSARSRGSSGGCRGARRWPWLLDCSASTPRPRASNRRGRGTLGPDGGHRAADPAQRPGLHATHRHGGSADRRSGGRPPG